MTGTMGQANAETVDTVSRGRESLWVRLIHCGSQLLQKIQSRPVRRLRVSETLSLGDKRQLLLVEYGDRQLLIGTAGNFLATLAELRDPAAAEGEKRG